MSGNNVAPNEKDPFRIVRAIRDLFEGRGNHTGTFTMRADEDDTTVAAPNCGAESKITITPTTADAATEFAAGTWYISSVTEGAFVIEHTNDPSESRTFHYSIQG
jgi:hypothetical protein